MALVLTFVLVFQATLDNDSLLTGKIDSALIGEEIRPKFMPKFRKPVLAGGSGFLTVQGPPYN